MAITTIFLFSPAQMFKLSFSFNSLGNHGQLNRWSDNSAAEIEGVVFDVKPGGIESTNCLAQDLAYRDTHIEIVRSIEDSGLTRRLIVEVTPRLRAMAAKRGLDWSTEALQALKGHKVRIIGWMLFDFEHIDESENTAPKRRDIWRATAWEIHPVTDIIVLESAVQYGLKEFRKSDSEKSKVILRHQQH